MGASGWLPSTSQDFFCVAVGIVGSFWNSLGPPLLPRDDAGSCRHFILCRALRGMEELPRCPSSEVPACWGNVCGVLLGTHLALPFPPGCTRAGPGARVPWALLVVPWEKLKRPGSPDRERDGEQCLLNLEPTQETNKQTPQQITGSKLSPSHLPTNTAGLCGSVVPQEILPPGCPWWGTAPLLSQKWGQTQAFVPWRRWQVWGSHTPQERRRAPRCHQERRPQQSPSGPVLVRHHRSDTEGFVMSCGAQEPKEHRCLGSAATASTRAQQTARVLLFARSVSPVKRDRVQGSGLRRKNLLLSSRHKATAQTTGPGPAGGEKEPNLLLQMAPISRLVTPSRAPVDQAAGGGLDFIFFLLLFFDLILPRCQR